MSRILLAYASTHGHTAKIAARVAHVLRKTGHHVVLDGDIGNTDPDINGYDAVVAGASIHGGRFQSDLVDWATRHATSLSLRPSAFFSVCLTAAEDSEESRQATRDYLDDFEERSGWTPRLRTTFAGALQYREYGLPTRMAMQVMMRRGHHPADIGRDYDYTDWDAVEAFARECAALLAPAAV